MSLYAEYLKERTDDEIFEDERGFITWRYVNDTQVYIVDIFVKKPFRKGGAASLMADHVCSVARKKGITQAIGTVVPSTKGADASLRVLWGYGMKLLRAEIDLIVLIKEI